jgi:O-antigen ligase/Tfp pilus assembly protein PilF
METASALLLFLLLYGKSKSRDSHFYRVPGLLPITLLLIYAFIQVIPIPAGVVKILSPQTYALYSDTVGTVELLSWITLSIHPKATSVEIFRMACYVAFYIVTVQIFAEKDNLKKTVQAIIIFASILSFFSIIQYILSNNKIYWIRELTKGGTPFGPYVNRNHYAGLMGMIFPLALSLFLFYKPDFSYGSLRERLSGFFSQRMTNVHILLGFSSLLIALSVFLSLSRGGIVSLSISMIFLGLMLIQREGVNRRSILLILMFVMTLYSVGWFGWDPIFKRFEKMRNVSSDVSEVRLTVWKDSSHIIEDFPVTGTGFGSFVNIYPKYGTYAGEAVVDHAHNDYIELFTDGGLVAVLLFSWFMVSVLYKSYQTFLRRREPYLIYLFIGAATGMISILVHSITDFNLHIGANGLYFFFLAGLVVSSAHTRFFQSEETYLKKIHFSSFSKFVLPAFMLLLICIIYNASLLMGNALFSPLKNISLSNIKSDAELKKMKERLYRSTQFDPLESRYHFAIGHIEKLLVNNESALEHYKRAVSLNPSNSEYLQGLGLAMSDYGRHDTAGKLLKSGVTYERRNTFRYQVNAVWLISQGLIDEGMRYIREALSMEPQRTADYIAMMVLNGLNDNEIRRALPELAAPYARFADYLLQTGDIVNAEDSYLRALEYAERQEKIDPSFYIGAYSFYRKLDRQGDALFVIKRALENVPGDIKVRLTAARAYEEAGMLYKAVEEYNQVMRLDPKNKKAERAVLRLTESKE